MMPTNRALRTRVGSTSSTPHSAFGFRRVADFDLDGDVNLSAFAFFQACFNGPNRAYPFADCDVQDLDNDSDVDLTDFAGFQACFNGPNRPPACQ